MKTLYLDCFSGISGDMTVGALRDLGVEESVFIKALECLDLQNEFHAHFHRGERCHVSGWKFEVHSHDHGTAPHSHHHHHDEHHHHHGHAHGRTFSEIRDILEKSSLHPEVKEHSLSIFHRIAVAEGRIHGVPPAEVAFHEVGAIDSIADIVAVSSGIHALGIERVYASRPVEGSGWIDCAHGRFPLPAPATLEILSGVPLSQVEESVEFITPTGAAILAEYVSAFGLMPEMTISSIGYGLGSRDTTPRPNVLRAILGEMTATLDAEADEITKIETNIDDLSPELAGAAMERLFATGALDVFYTPVQMKKNRPGFLLTVLAAHEKVPELVRLILTETSAFGVRLQRVQRMKLRREFRDVETPYGSVRIKLGFLGDELVQAAPEYESCREVARKAGVSVKDVHIAAWIGAPPSQ